MGLLQEPLAMGHAHVCVCSEGWHEFALHEFAQRDACHGAHCVPLLTCHGDQGPICACVAQSVRVLFFQLMF